MYRWESNEFRITNIEKIDRSSWIYKLIPIRFNYKKKINKKYIDKAVPHRIYGITAEDALRVNKDLCIFHDPYMKEGLEGVDYRNLIIPLLVELKYLRERVLKLERDMGQVKPRLNLFY